MIRPAISLILAISPLLITPEIPWSKSKSGGGVIVYTRPVVGSDIKEIKATFELSCSLNSAVACVTDIANYPKWIYATSESRVLKVISPTEITIYQRINTPWPLDDRDICGHYVMKQDPTTLDVNITTHAEPKLVPNKDGVVRIQFNRTIWNIKSLAKNKLHCEYYITFDPAGTVPAWMINLFISEGPYSSLTKLIQEVKQPKYANIKHSWIREKHP